MVQLERGLVITGVTRNVCARQCTTHCARTTCLRFLDVLARPRIVVFRRSDLGPFAVIMSDLQRQRATAQNLQALTRIDGFFPFAFLLVDAAEILERLDLITGTLCQTRK